jgi:hypothetical protein
MDILRTVTADERNPVIGDIYTDADGNIVWTSDETGESTAQRLRIRFAFWRGEYFADLRQGVPYLPDVLGNKPDISTVAALLRGVILTTPGIVGLARYVTSFDDRARVLSLDFVAILASGQTFVSADFGPFLVEGIQA